MFLLFQRFSCVALSYRNYTQGQVVNGVRQYFYYIDHEGQLFLDDTKIKNFTSCFKDVQFLTFFFHRLRVNRTSTHEADFPFVSDCGTELNFLRCEDRPIVFTSLDPVGMRWTVCNSKRRVPFEPAALCMLANGRLYHPAPLGQAGLVKSSLAIQLSARLRFDGAGRPTSVEWAGQQIPLHNQLLRDLRAD